MKSFGNNKKLCNHLRIFSMPLAVTEEPLRNEKLRDVRILTSDREVKSNAVHVDQVAQTSISTQHRAMAEACVAYGASASPGSAGGLRWRAFFKNGCKWSFENGELLFRRIFMELQRCLWLKTLHQIIFNIHDRSFLHMFSANSADSTFTQLVWFSEAFGIMNELPCLSEPRYFIFLINQIRPITVRHIRCRISVKRSSCLRK